MRWSKFLSRKWLALIGGIITIIVGPEKAILPIEIITAIYIAAETILDALGMPRKEKNGE